MAQSQLTPTSQLTWGQRITAKASMSKQTESYTSGMAHHSQQRAMACRFKVHKVLRATRVTKAILVQKAHKDHRVQLGRTEHRAKLDHRVLKASKEFKVSKVRKVFKVKKVSRDLKVSLVRKANKDHKEFKARLVQQALQQL